MRRDWIPEVIPLGLRLQAATQQLAQTHHQHFAWLAPALHLLQRVGEMTNADKGRFERIEAEDVRALDGPAFKPADGPRDGRLIPARVRERLQAQVGNAAHLMQVHDDEQAHRIAQQHHADAVSLGPDVFFARGRYQPHDNRGVALLAHEAVHVAHAMQPNVGWQRSSEHGLAVEEAMAAAAERAALKNDTASPYQNDGMPAAVASPAGHAHGAMPATTSPARTPMAAETARPVNAPVSTAAAIDLDALRQSLMRELRNQIRSDMERGG